MAKAKKKAKKKVSKKKAVKKKKKAKKVAKKRPTKKKKPTTKKATRITSTSKIPAALKKRLQKLLDAPLDKHFHLANGKKIKNVHDLLEELHDMAEEVYDHHVTPYKNDFSSWLYHVFNEVELARILANEKSKNKTIIIIKEYYKK